MLKNFYTCKTRNQKVGGNNIISIEKKNLKFTNGGVLTFKSLYKERERE